MLHCQWQLKSLSATDIAFREASANNDVPASLVTWTYGGHRQHFKEVRARDQEHLLPPDTNCYVA